MKNALQLSLIIILALLLGQHESFAQQQVDQQLSGFTSLAAGSGVNVYLSQGNSESVKIEASEEAFQYLITEVDRNKRLTIRLENSMKQWFTRTGPINVYISFKELQDIEVSGGADLFGEEELSFHNLRMGASGGSDIKISLQANELELRCSGGSDAVVDGYTAYFKGSASGGSDIKAKDLVTEVADISVSGGSDAFITVKRELTASASGGSDINYYGSPAKLNSNKSGGSDITKR